jgi:hypothetical protein
MLHRFRSRRKRGRPEVEVGVEGGEAVAGVAVALPGALDESDRDPGGLGHGARVSVSGGNVGKRGPTHQFAASTAGPATSFPARGDDRCPMLGSDPEDKKNPD